jgi:hypothetical protein
VSQPGPAWPGPARAPLVPPALPMRPLPLIPLSHLIFSHAVTSLSLLHLSLSPWCPRVWRRDRRSLDPRGEFPLPSPSSPPRGLPARPARPSAPRPTSPHGRTAPSRARPRVLPVPGGGGPRRAPPLPVVFPRRRLGCPPHARQQSGPTLVAPRPRPPARLHPAPAARPRARARLAPGGGGLAPTPRRASIPGLEPSVAPCRALACPRHAQRTFARATVVARRSAPVLIHFNFSLVNVLRRATILLIYIY